MLRSTLRASRRPAALTFRSVANTAIRYRSEDVLSSDPGLRAPAPTTKPEVPPGPVNRSASTSTPTASSKPPESAPKAPPPPPPNPAGQGPPAAPTRKRTRRFRWLLYLLLAGGVAYAGGIFYALRSDNFHDFFTEYIPFGEEAVLYFEEWSFRRRFPQARQPQSHSSGSAARRDGSKVTIPQKAGLSWRVAEEGEKSGSDLIKKGGRHMSALDANTLEEPPSEKHVAAVESVKKPASPPSPETSTTSSAQKSALQKANALTEKKAGERPPSPATPSPKHDPCPPAVPPVARISPLQIDNADEPLIQELVEIVNGLIAVINADSADASNRYSRPITKAKESLAGIGAKILALKEAEKKKAEETISQAHKEFDEGAKGLLRRIDAARQEDDAKFREEFEEERERISRAYEKKLETELERARQLAEQSLKNELAKQSIEMKRQFVSDIKSLVEEEREGRLSKLSELSTSVGDLQQLTSNWNGVIDSNLATQKLQVAVDAVRAALNSTTAADDRPKPFVREMAALKLVANGDCVVDAAIASVNPSAYQRGIPSPAQLIDRFRRVASEVRKASLLPEGAGVASHAASVLLSKIMFKKEGQPEGNDVESILTRTESLLEEGDLDGAAREMNSLQGWAATLSKDWIQDCRKVLEVKQALDVIETEARLQCLRVE